MQNDTDGMMTMEDLEEVKKAIKEYKAGKTVPLEDV
jgi:hypothetical protein